MMGKGGVGGHGNVRIRTAVSPESHYEPQGWPREDALFWLRLKVIAELGVISMSPGVASTFVSVVIKTLPKIPD